MKTAILTTLAVSLFGLHAQAASTNNAKLLATIQKEPMIRAALKYNRAAGEKCDVKLVSAEKSDGGTKFEAQINCWQPASDNLGDGIVESITITGSSFDDFLDQFVISVSRAG